MSVTVKFTISDDNYKTLCRRAEAEKLGIQDYIRQQLFPEQIPFTPQDAVRRALNTYEPGDTFTVPEIYGDSWNLPNGMAGQFGKKFCALVEQEYTSQIRFTGQYDRKRHAVYQRL